jgi:hypothetical protein
MHVFSGVFPELPNLSEPTEIRELVGKHRIIGPFFSSAVRLTLSLERAWRNLEGGAGKGFLMFRRCISTLVLVGFVGGQLATFPHAHAGYAPEEQRRHDARPHIHTGPGEHSNDHSHSHDGHSHSHPAKAAANGESSPFDVYAPCAEHDADAIYLPSGACSPVALKEQRAATSTDPVSAGESGASPISLPAIARYGPESIHPPIRVAGAKLFLTLRTLRI